MAVQFIGGQILFDTSKIAFNSDCCCAGACVNCTATPSKLQVTFGGTWAGSCQNGDCTTFSTDSPYVLDQVTAGGAECNYLHTLASPECDGFDDITKVRGLFYSVFGDYRLRITLEGESTHVMHWDYNFGASKPDCTNEDGLNTGLLIPFDSDSGTACDGSSVTCTVTTL